MLERRTAEALASNQQAHAATCAQLEKRVEPLEAFSEERFDERFAECFGEHFDRHIHERCGLQLQRLDASAEELRMELSTASEVQRQNHQQILDQLAGHKQQQCRDLDGCMTTWMEAARQQAKSVVASEYEGCSNDGFANGAQRQEEEELGRVEAGELQQGRFVNDACPKVDANEQSWAAFTEGYEELLARVVVLEHHATVASPEKQLFLAATCAQLEERFDERFAECFGEHFDRHIHERCGVQLQRLDASAEELRMELGTASEVQRRNHQQILDQLAGHEQQQCRDLDGCMTTWMEAARQQAESVVAPRCCKEDMEELREALQTCRSDGMLLERKILAEIARLTCAIDNVQCAMVDTPRKASTRRDGYLTPHAAECARLPPFGTPRHGHRAPKRVTSAFSSQPRITSL
eukprot:NODE_4776_length_1849_cov_6.714286.p1 GENE.NODE_4776_length_1849_cov_6.714286~~NODE_4776_length_1849_cov_6.714286.p1  ORF type:complete len:409 (-),score=125.80 NODE_4776_length_1849_cov_6.714286:223-1449(-)